MQSVEMPLVGNKPKAKRVSVSNHPLNVNRAKPGSAAKKNDIEEPSVKRVKTSGSSSVFNVVLPVPKKAKQLRANSSVSMPKQGSELLRSAIESTIRAQCGSDAHAFALVYTDGNSVTHTCTSRLRPQLVDTWHPQAKSLQIGDEHAVRAFFNGAFSAIQQLGMKWILKQWIKAIEPKKQANFPYVLGNPEKMKERCRRQTQTTKTTSDPELPKWWPEDVHFKEPDHILKEERLLVAWSIIQTCDQEKARELLEGELISHPWTKLLQSSTTDRVKLRTDKETADKGWEARQRFERRNRLLDGVYAMARSFEDFRSGRIHASTTVNYIDEFSLHRSSVRSRRDVEERDTGHDEHDDDVPQAAEPAHVAGSGDQAKVIDASFPAPGFIFDTGYEQSHHEAVAYQEAAVSHYNGSMQSMEWPPDPRAHRPNTIQAMRFEVGDPTFHATQSPPVNLAPEANRYDFAGSGWIQPTPPANNHVATFWH